MGACQGLGARAVAGVPGPRAGKPLLAGMAEHPQRGAAGCGPAALAFFWLGAGLEDAGAVPTLVVYGMIGNHFTWQSSAVS